MFKIDDGSVLDFPGICSLCNSQPTKGEYAIDTELKYVDATARHLVAHKYVCQKCAEELITLVPSSQVEKLKKELAVWKAKYGQLITALDTFTKGFVGVND